MDWAAVDRLVERAPGTDGVLYHRLGVFAARRLRAQGRPVPAPLQEEERLAALAAMTAGPALKRVLAASEEPVLVLKGPEIARRYPPDAPRPYRDLDLLALDPAAVQAALLAAGAEPVYEEPVRPDLHHDQSLVFPGLPMVIEVHRAPKWPAWAAAPPADELFGLARPYGGDGARLLVLPDAEHAVVVAAHAWAHRPLRRVLDLVDVSLLAGLHGSDAARAAARRWGVERLWGVTIAAAAAVLCGAPGPWPLTVWARDLKALRERTAVEGALERWLAPAACRPPLEALAAGAAQVARDFRRRRR